MVSEGRPKSDSDDYDFDVHDRREAMEMMDETEDALYEGEVLTGTFYVDEDRPSYQQEKRGRGELPDAPLAERYFDDDAEWERSFDFVDRHT